jgi:LytS/YehU family sensor histidine kinase
MYRYILEKREESMSSVEREMEMLDVYMYLLKTRHENSLNLELNIDEAYYQHFLPTLSLQMLVENAVKHNNFSKTQPLLIEIFVENEYLVVKNIVRKKGTPVQSTKVGLENIRNQYELQSDKNVIIVDDEEFFTVKIPVLSILKFA